jgi:SAM-dependent methyltransferase
MLNTDYLRIVKHIERCLERHGDTPQGVDWPNRQDAETRYRVMLDLIPQIPGLKPTVLDFGCGASHLYEYLLRLSRSDIQYSGLDLSEKFVELSRRKHSQINYFCLDILTHGDELPMFDYIIMNGVFTEKVDLDFHTMLDYFQRTIEAVFAKTRLGMSFNVMSSHVDWEREDLFHLPLDTLAAFLTKRLTRNFVIRNDYGLYEYTTYVYRIAVHG